MKKILFSASCALILVTLSATASEKPSISETTVKVIIMKNELLVDATKRGDDRAVLALLNLRDINPNYQDTTGKTPLHYTTQNGKKALTQVLLMRGANPTIEDLNGETPLSLATKNNQKEIVELLNKQVKPTSS